MATNNKIKFPFWVTPKTMEIVKEMYKDMIAGANRNLLKKQYTHMSVIYGQITVRECCRIIWSPR